MRGTIAALVSFMDEKIKNNKTNRKDKGKKMIDFGDELMNNSELVASIERSAYIQELKRDLREDAVSFFEENGCKFYREGDFLTLEVPQYKLPNDVMKAIDKKRRLFADADKWGVEVPRKGIEVWISPVEK